MASKQMEIIVKATDQATPTLKNIGGGAEEAGRKFSGFDSVVSAGKGVKGILRTGKAVVIAAEAIPLALDSASAAWKTFTGSAEEAAAGQRKLFETIGGIPIIGKKLSEFAEYTSTKLAHAFGRQSTAEVEAETARKKQILEDFASTIKKLGEATNTSNNEAHLLGLLPTEVEIEKAKQKFQKQMDDLKAFKKSVIEAAGQGQDTSAQTAQIAQITANAKKVEAYEVAQADAKMINDEQAFSGKLREESYQRGQDLVSLVEDQHAKELQADNRGYEARLENIKAQLRKQSEAIAAEFQKQIQEYEKQITDLEPAAKAGDAKAQERINKLREAQAEAREQRDERQNTVDKTGEIEQKAAREEAIRQARLSTLQAEAAAGDANAKVQLGQLETAKQREATERALLAIANDAKATDEQRKAANEQLAELKKSQQQAAQNTLDQNELSTLQKQAALGDENAKIQLEQLQHARERKEAEAQLNGVLQNQAATEEQKAEAQRQLNELKSVEIQQDLNTEKDAGLFILGQEAALGDKIADKELKRFQLQKQFNDEREKLQAILEGDASDEAKDNAAKLLGGLDATQKRAEERLGQKGNKQGELASLVESQFETGVAASKAQQQSEYQPIIDAQNNNTSVTAEVRDAIRDLLDFVKGNTGSKKALT